MKKIKHKSFLTVLPGRREEKVFLAMCGKVSINEAENKFLEEKNYIYPHSPLVGSLPLL